MPSITGSVNGEPGFDDTLKSKDDPGWVEVAEVSLVLDPEIFLESLNVKAAQAQFAQAIGATYESYKTCELFESIVSDLQSAVISALEASAGAIYACCATKKRVC